MTSIPTRSLNFAMRANRTICRGGRRRLAAERLEARRMFAGFVFNSVQAIGDGVHGASANGGLVIDDRGDSYVAGYFEGAVDFDPANVHPGDADLLASVGNGRDLFVAKYSAQGPLLWARAIESDVTVAGKPEIINEIGLDGQGSLYVTGDFADTLRAGSFSITSTGDQDGFLWKFSETGEPLWVSQWGTSLRDTGTSVAVGPEGEVYVAGIQDDDAVNDVGRTVVQKFDPVDGDQLWLRSVDSGSYPPKIDADSAGNINLASTFWDPFDANPGAQVHMLSHGEAPRAVSSTFVLQLASNGDFNWAHAFQLQTPAGANENSLAQSQRLVVDRHDAVIVVGQHFGGVDYDPSLSGSAQLGFSAGVYVAKLNSTGEFRWVSGAAGSAVYQNRSIQVDAANHVVIGGYLNSYSGEIIDFDPGAEFTGLTPANIGGSYMDSYVWSLTTEGEFRSLDHIGSAGSVVQVLGLGIAPTNQLQVVGSFVGAIDFDPDAGAATLNTTARSAFSLRLDATPGVTVDRRGNHFTSESGQGTVLEVSLDAPPAADVYIPVSSSDPTEGNASVAGLLFSPSNWNVPQSIAVTGVDDETVDGDVGYSIVLGAAASPDPAFHGLNAVDIAVTNYDDDMPATKFYVVNDASSDRTYEYASDGTTIENYQLGSGNTSPRGAASTAAGTTVWVGDKNRKVYVYDVDGSLQGSWTAGTLTTTAQVEGIATNGADVWVVDGKSDKVYRYANAAGRLSGSQTAASSFSLNSGNKAPKGIVTDGVHLWVVNDASTDKVFKYTLNGSLVGSWTIDSANKSPTGLTIDPSNGSQDIWIVDSGTDRVYQYANGRAKTSGSLSAATNFRLAAGNSNPQGIADPPLARTERAAAGMSAVPPALLPSDLLLGASRVDATAPTQRDAARPTEVAQYGKDSNLSVQPGVKDAAFSALHAEYAGQLFAVTERRGTRLAIDGDYLLFRVDGEAEEAIELIASDVATWHRRHPRGAQTVRVS
jgi:hypothetical protein